MISESSMDVCVENRSSSVQEAKQALFVADEVLFHDLIDKAHLEWDFITSRSGSFDEMIERIQTERVDIIVIDLDLIERAPADMIKDIRQIPYMHRAPLLLISGMHADSQVAALLESGADDLLNKPVLPRVLAARMRSLLRQRLSAADEEPELRFGELSILPKQHQVNIANREIQLSVTEFRILHALASQPRWVLDRKKLIALSRGPECNASLRSVDVSIARLRMKLKPLEHTIETVYNIGYRFTPPDIS